MPFMSLYHKILKKREKNDQLIKKKEELEQQLLEDYDKLIGEHDKLPIIQSPLNQKIDDNKIKPSSNLRTETEHQSQNEQSNEKEHQNEINHLSSLENQKNEEETDIDKDKNQNINKHKLVESEKKILKTPYGTYKPNSKKPPESSSNHKSINHLDNSISEDLKLLKIHQSDDLKANNHKVTESEDIRSYWTYKPNSKKLQEISLTHKSNDHSENLKSKNLKLPKINQSNDLKNSENKNQTLKSSKKFEGFNKYFKLDNYRLNRDKRDLNETNASESSLNPNKQSMSQEYLNADELKLPFIEQNDNSKQSENDLNAASKKSKKDWVFNKYFKVQSYYLKTGKLELPPINNLNETNVSESASSDHQSSDGSEKAIKKIFW